jgi:hypothetical protein
MNIYPISRIYYPNFTSAYFGLDSRGCECLKYLFIYKREERYNV